MKPALEIANARLTPISSMAPNTARVQISTVTKRPIIFATESTR